MKEIFPPSRTYYEHKLGSPEKAQHFPNKNCRTKTKKTGKLSNLKFIRTEDLPSFQTPQRMKRSAHQGTASWHAAVRDKKSFQRQDEDYNGTGFSAATQEAPRQSLSTLGGNSGRPN